MKEHTTTTKAAITIAGETIIIESSNQKFAEILKSEEAEAIFEAMGASATLVAVEATEEPSTELVEELPYDTDQAELSLVSGAEEPIAEIAIVNGEVVWKDDIAPEVVVAMGKSAEELAKAA